jgi:methionine-S-sulfoxide reductase
MEAPFDKLNGVISTTSGYTGGHKKDPTYKEVSHGGTGHAEAVQIVYDPKKVSYTKLLDVFWHNVDPTNAHGQFCDNGDQYRSEIFYHNEEQRRLAVASEQELEKNKPFAAPIVTRIAPATTFYPAEDYHQKHYLKGSKQLLDVLRKRYPDQQELFLSTDAARLNGYLGCNGDPALLGDNIRALDLPANLESSLFDNLTLTCRNFKGGCALPPLGN